MEIGIDALPLAGRGGVSRHLVDLLPALAERLEGGDRLHLFFRAFRPAERRALEALRRRWNGERFCWHRVAVPHRLLELAWTRYDVPIPGAARCLRHADVLLATTGLTPGRVDIPVVTVVHDLVPLRFPEWFPEAPLVRRRIERAIERSRSILAVSRSTARDLERLAGAPPEKIRVVYHGVHDRFRPVGADELARRLDRRGLRRPYFLYVGALGPVKNVETLLDAYLAYRDRAPDPHELVLAASPRWASPALGRRLDELAEHGVRSLGFCDDEDLPALYTGATAVVLPSWHESFGFPGLEAMACGRPVVASRVGALPELLEDDALFFDPAQPAELAHRLETIAADARLAAELGVRGRRRAGRFTWARAAAETLAVLREARARP